MKLIELLSPAKNKEAGIAAINYGADAVYIGAPKFGARAEAGNSLHDIEELIKYAHKFNAQVFITLNTLLYDNEFEDVQKIIKSVYNAGADALIIQDFGILELDLPPIPLHSSTQMDNSSLEKIQFLENVGFKRAILARELSIDKIKCISKNTNIELECFIHGALCVSYSGQCYFSQYTQNRSGNRGVCAQNCRMKYSLVDSNNRTIQKDKYLLSLKDLNLSDHLEELINSGISSFKIEGRLKDLNYVKSVVSFYRQQIDQIIDSRENFEKSSSGKINHKFTPDLNKSFNRGFTKYFINGRSEKVLSNNTPKSIGEKIGKVYKSNNSIKIHTGKNLTNGDGLCFFNKNGELEGFRIQKVNGEEIIPSKQIKINNGTTIYRNYNFEFNKQLNNDNTERKIEVDLILAKSDKSVSLTAIDQNGNRVVVEVELSVSKAEKPDLSRRSILVQLKKSGGTIFEVCSIMDKTGGKYFIPKRYLNKLRRSAFIELENKRTTGIKKQEIKAASKNIVYPKSELDYRGNVVNQKSKKFFVNHGVKEIEKGFELKRKEKDLVLMKTKHCIKYQLNMCPKYSKDQNQISLFEEPLYLKDQNNKYKIEFDCNECIMKILST